MASYSPSLAHLQPSSPAQPGLLCKGAALSRFRLEGNGQCTRQGAIEARRLQHLQDEVDVLGPFTPLLPIQATGLVVSRDGKAET